MKEERPGGGPEDTDVYGVARRQCVLQSVARADTDQALDRVHAPAHHEMLELEWVNLHRKKSGEPQDIGYISGELFGAGGLTATPDNPRGSRSKSLELRCKGAGEWNVYDVVRVDGTVKLAINGKFVNSIRNSSVRQGYLCLESEGSEIHCRNIRILELPPGITTPDQTANELE